MPGIQPIGVFQEFKGHAFAKRNIKDHNICGVHTQTSGTSAFGNTQLAS